MLLGGGIASVANSLPWVKPTFQQSNGANDPAFDQYQEKIQEAYRTIKANYVRDVKDEQLINGALKGMVQSLGDPYSDYMNPVEAKEFMQDLDSSFSGIGAEVSIKNGHLTVVSPIKGSPAEKAGIRSEDQILRVNGKSLEGLTVQEAVSHIRGPKGSKVQLEIIRPGSSEVQKISVVRDEIPLVTVHSKMLPDQVGYIQVTQFSKETANEFFKQMGSLEKQGMKGLVIDVRGNPGGLLPAVKSMAEQLVPNKKPILQTQDRAGKKQVYNSKVDQAKPYPIAVLIDKGSASASEILAGALKEGAGYPLIGDTTFGKGTVQSAIDFDDGSNLKLTIAKWLTPKGNWVDQHGGTKGIKPDISVKQPDYAYASPLQNQQVLKQDQNSSEVKNLQLMLEALGYSPGRTDGYFDGKTANAVIALQKVAGLTASGQVDSATAQKINDLFRNMLSDPKNDVQLQVAVETVKKKIK